MGPMNAMQAAGDVVKLARTNPAHIVGAGEAATPARQERAGGIPQAAQNKGVEGNFGALLMNALGGVNDSQLKAMDLSKAMVTDPNSVNVEDVTIALADANLAISMTKAVVDRALAAYREIINVR
jgi:flagellar hook-basal body complex protein FliE